MASLPGIVIKVTTDTAKAVQGLNRVNSAMGRTMTRGQKFSATMQRVGPALATAAAAAGAAALAIGVDAVKAFAEDEKSAKALATTLDNLDMGGRTDELEGWVDQLQYAANVADTALRPALSRLLLSTNDVTQAQEGLQIALDVAAGTGKDLDTVTAALAKAYDGNAGALGRLGVGIDKYILASGDMSVITQELIDKFGGQSAASADTLEGSIAGVSVAWDELTERLGKGLVIGAGGGTDAAKGLENQLRGAGDEVEDLGQSAGTASTFGLAFLTDALKGLTDEGGVLWVFNQLLGQSDSELRGSAAAAWSAANAYSHLAKATDQANASMGRAAAAATWNSGYVTQRNQADYLARRRRQDAKAAAKAAAAKAARDAKIADRKHAARTGTRAANPKPGKRSC